MNVDYPADNGEPGFRIGLGAIPAFEPRHQDPRMKSVALDESVAQNLVNRFTPAGLAQLTGR